MRSVEETHEAVRASARRSNGPLRRHIKYLDLGLLAAGGGNGKPRANGLPLQSTGDRHACLKRNGARQPALRLHLLEHLVAQRNSIRRIGTQTRNLLGIHAQRIKEVVKNEQLAIDKAPIDTLAVNQVVKLLFGKLRPLLADHLDSPITRHRKMKRRLDHAIPLGANAGSQRRLRVLLQKAIAGGNSLRQIPGILKTKNLRR